VPPGQTGAPVPAQPGQQVDQPKKPWFKKKRVMIPLVGLALIVGIAATQRGGGTAAAPGATTGAPATTAVSTQAPTTEPTEPAPAPTDDATTEPSEQPSEEPTAPSLSNGDHVVGVDIKPGVYRAEVEESVIQLCTVSQTKADGGIMDVRNANEGSVIFTVKDAKDSVVSFSGCGLIGLAADMVRSDPDAITNGYWLVGPELAAGRYQGVVDTESVVQLGTIVQQKANGDIMDIRNANEGKVVFTVKEAKGSVVSFSGFKEIKKVG
jgi:hypothetical protein